MSEQAEKFLAQWEIEHVKMVARSDREKMQPEQGSAARIWKLLLKGI